MKRITIDGENWLISAADEYGDLLVLTGSKEKDCENILVSGSYLECGAYYTLLRAFAAYGGRFMIYLDIPYLIRKDIQDWLYENGLLSMVSFAASENIENQMVFAEKILVDSGLDGSYFLPNQAKIIWSRHNALAEYLRERFGDVK